VGNVEIETDPAQAEIETDPAQALKDYVIAQDRFNALPESKQDTLPASRLKANLIRKRAMALRELADFGHAAPLFDQALDIQKKIAAQDPEDSRSQFDAYVDLTQAACNYEDAADPAFAGGPADRHRNLAIAATLLTQAQSIALQLLRVNPSNDDWRAGLADVEVRLGTAEQELGKPEGAAALSSAGVAALKEMAQKHQARCSLWICISGLFSMPGRWHCGIPSWQSKQPSTKRSSPGDIRQTFCSRSRGRVTLRGS
jgi:tetratricopeptide (TPR) repeat protein